MTGLGGVETTVKWKLINSLFQCKHWPAGGFEITDVKLENIGLKAFFSFKLITSFNVNIAIPADSIPKDFGDFWDQFREELCSVLAHVWHPFFKPPPK